MKKNPLAVKLGQLAKGVKKTMTNDAMEQRRNANKSRWAKWRSRNRKKRKVISVRNLALLVAAAALFGSALLIYIGETSPRPGYAVKLPGGIEIFP